MDVHAVAPVDDVATTWRARAPELTCLAVDALPAPDDELWSQ